MKEKSDALKAFLIHLAVFVAVNIILLFVPVIFNGKAVFDFEGREAIFYGSAGWGIGVFIHGAVVFLHRKFCRTN